MQILNNHLFSNYNINSKQQNIQNPQFKAKCSEYEYAQMLYELVQIDRMMQKISENKIGLKNTLDALRKTVTPNLDISECNAFMKKAKEVKSELQTLINNNIENTVKETKSCSPKHLPDYWYLDAGYTLDDLRYHHLGC